MCELKPCAQVLFQSLNATRYSESEIPKIPVNSKSLVFVVFQRRFINKGNASYRYLFSTNVILNLCLAQSMPLAFWVGYVQLTFGVNCIETLSLCYISNNQACHLIEFIEMLLYQRRLLNRFQFELLILMCAVCRP